MGRRSLLPGGPKTEQIWDDVNSFLSKAQCTDVGSFLFFFFVILLLKREHSGLKANTATFKDKRQRGRAGALLLQIKRLL